MKFSDAIKELIDGKRIACQKWRNKEVYLKMLDGVVRHFSPSLEYYGYDQDILLSTDWKIDGKEGLYAFPDIIEWLKAGERARLSDWTETYIYYESDSDSLVKSSMQPTSYIPSMYDMTGEWIVYE